MPTKKQLAKLLEDVMVASDNITDHNHSGADDYVHDTFILIDQAEYDAIITAADYIREQFEGEVEGLLNQIKKHSARVPWIQHEELLNENKKLKAELNDFVSVFDGNTSMKKMKEENEKLKAELTKADKHYDYQKTAWDKEQVLLRDENKTLIHQIGKAEEENEKLKEQMDQQHKVLQEIKKQVLSLSN